jgi:hypothetical protein
MRKSGSPEIVTNRHEIKEKAKTIISSSPASALKVNSWLLKIQNKFSKATISKKCNIHCEAHTSFKSLKNNHT